MNSKVPLSDTVNIYVFGGYSRKDIQAFGFLSAPVTTANATLSIYPDGYTQRQPIWLQRLLLLPHGQREVLISALKLRRI